ncbi:MAG TPA: DEAD/DEAH box helicase [Pirellulales bacterium]|nr:DEAD/DEAH box helicase [Pirellulales bacterium]
MAATASIRPGSIIGGPTLPEAVYGYFLKLPRIRFLLADDPGAGKTIMAGLLLEELKARGLVRRALIVTPANLTFQWQRELADKFREQFDVIRGDVLRANYGQNPWVRRSLERMRARRQKILDDPEAYRQEQIERKLPDDFEDLTEEELQKIVDQLEDEVLSVDPAALREEIGRLAQLVAHAKQLEERDVQTKLLKLRAILQEEGLFDNPKMKLLVFTEHKDTLDYLAGDGRDERPLGKLREWGLTLAQIHGGMKIGDRDTPGSRISAEREFRDPAQVLLATVAAGEGINLQFAPFPCRGASRRDDTCAELY